MENETLWRNYKEFNDVYAKTLLIEEYIKLVKIIAGRLYTSYGTIIEYDDLVSYGIFGLIDAIEKFNLSKHVKFETYANIRIRGAIIDNLRNLDWIPRSVRQKSKELENVYKKLENKLCRTASDYEVAKELGVTIKELHKIMIQTLSFNIVSLEEAIFEGNVSENTQNKSQLPEDILCRQETYDTLKDNINKLPEREKQVISLYYYNNFTYKEIGQVLEISESRVSQLHSKAISRLRSKLTLK